MKKSNIRLLLSLILILIFFAINIKLVNSINITNNTSIYINEIMFDPIGSDNNREFVEIVGINNLSGFIVGDNVQNDTLELMQYNDGCNFSLIVEEDFDFDNLNCSIYSAGSTIGNGLSNTIDSVFLFFNNSLIDSVNYSSEDEGYSYSYYNFSWRFSEQVNGTPCLINFFNNTNTTINQTEINESGNSTNVSNNISDECNVSISIRIYNNQSIFNFGDKIKYYNELSNTSYDYSIEYWITDYFNNSLKSKTSTTNLNQKQWTARSEDKYEFIKIKNRIDYINCTNINNKTYSEISAFVVNENSSESLNDLDSDIEFTKSEISGNSVAISGILYKGDTTKSVFSMEFQCLDKDDKKIKSEELKIYMNKKYSSNEFYYKIPINDVKDDCCSSPEIIYSGLDLDGNNVVSNFVESDECDVDNVISDDILVIDQETNQDIQDNITDVSPTIIFHNNNSVNISKYFENISSNIFSGDSQVSSIINASESKITGNLVKQNLDIKYKPISFVNIGIVFLLLFIIGFIFLKKW